MKRIARHLPHYLSLIGILFLSAFGFIYFSYDRTFQVAVAIALSASYTTWGIIHHYIHKDLYLTVILEYLTISLLGVTIIISLLLRA